MEIFDHLWLGFSVALSPGNLLYCLLGVTLGTFIGVLPGIGPVVTIAVLLPITFGLPPAGSLIMLAGIYYGAAYGGSTTSILLNLPGESSSVITCIDGYRLAQKGRAGPALAMAAIASFVAGCIGTLVLATFAIPIGHLALQFGPTEYFSLVLFALLATASLVHGSVWQGIGMALFGVLLGLVGTDINSGVRRFTFGIDGIADGLEFTVVAVGFFAFSEIVANLDAPEARSFASGRISGLMPRLSDLRESAASILRGTAMGAFVGLLPGAGQTISSFLAYMLEKRVGKHRHEIGTGVLQGVAAPEAANNSCSQTAFVPTLTLGIPGSPTMALILGALMIQGITPGPSVMTRQPDLFWGLIASMWVGNLLLVVLNLPLVGLWVSMLRIPYRWLYPAILMFASIGLYSVASSSLDILLVAVFGVLGYVFRKLDCEPAPLVLGFVLGPLLEENFRRALLLSRGDPLTFLEHPISAGFLLVALAIVIALLIPSLRTQKERALIEDV
jgi:TctA family transporter